MLERQPVEKQLWDTPYLRPEWRRDLKGILEATAPYEELYRAIGQEKKQDTWALMEILQSAGLLDEAMRISSQFAARIEGQLYLDWKRYKDSSRQKDIIKERDKAYKTLDVIIRRAEERYPLAAIFISEGSIVKRALEMTYAVREGQATVAKLQQEILANEPHEMGRTILRNALNLAAFAQGVEHTKVNGTISDELKEDIELCSGVEFQGVEFKPYQIGKQRWHCRVECREEEHPFVFGTGEIHIPGNPPLCFWLSRFHGDLLMDGTITTRVEGILTNTDMVSFFKRIIWNTVQYGIQRGEIKEVNAPAPSERLVQKPKIIESTTLPDIEAEKNTEDAVTTPANIPLEHEDGTDTHAETEKAKDATSEQILPEDVKDEKERRLHIPSLNYRQFTHALKKCGVRIVGNGSSHLDAVKTATADDLQKRPDKNEYSTFFYNAHKRSERLFHNSEIHEKLEALHIHPQLFLSKL